MKTHEFELILEDGPDLTDDLCDALFKVGCDDSSPGQRCGITCIYFHREADSLEDAIRSAIADVQKAGCQVERLEMDTDALTEKLKV